MIFVVISKCQRFLRILTYIEWHAIAMNVFGKVTILKLHITSGFCRWLAPILKVVFFPGTLSPGGLLSGRGHEVVVGGERGDAGLDPFP